MKKINLLLLIDILGLVLKEIRRKEYVFPVYIIAVV